MKYQTHNQITRQAAEESFSTRDVKKICETLVAISLHEPDWKWAQDKCLHYLNDENPDIQGISATCLGHIARIHGELEREKVLTALHAHLGKDITDGQIQDAIDDITMFLR